MFGQGLGCLLYTSSEIPIDQAGEILSESVIAGVNQVDSVSYFSSNYDASYGEALKGAIAMAQEKAQSIACLLYTSRPVHRWGTGGSEEA